MSKIQTRIVLFYVEIEYETKRFILHLNLSFVRNKYHTKKQT